MKTMTYVIIFRFISDFDNKKDHFLIENSHRQKNIDISKNVLYH